MFCLKCRGRADAGLAKRRGLGCAGGVGEEGVGVDHFSAHAVVTQVTCVEWDSLVCTTKVKVSV